LDRTGGETADADVDSELSRERRDVVVAVFIVGVTLLAA